MAVQTPMALSAAMSMSDGVSGNDKSDSNESGGEGGSDRNDNRFLVTITIPKDLNIRQIFFVLYFPRSNQWDNNHQQDYAIPLPSDPELLLPLLERDDLKVRSLLGRILARENRKSWEMGMRLEFIGQLLSEGEPSESVLSLLEIYLHYASQGHLPWRRHYDRQTSVLAPKIVGLALKISAMVSSTPRLLTFWLRMMKNLPSSSRNLQDIGSAIRLKILECKDHQNRLIYDQFVSEFHQKLHNASGPEDMAISRAYLAFLDSEGDLDSFLGSLWQAGLAKKEEAPEKEGVQPEKGDGEVIIPLLDQYGDYRSIHHLPTYEAKKAEATRKVIRELLTLLENFYGGMEIEEAAALVMPEASPDIQQQLQGLLAQKEEFEEELETNPSASASAPASSAASVSASPSSTAALSPSSALAIIVRLSRLRSQLSGQVTSSSPLAVEKIRDFLHLDLVMEDYAKALANALLNDLPGREGYCGISPEHLELLQALLAHLSPICTPVCQMEEQQIAVVRRHLIQWSRKGHDIQWQGRGGHGMELDWCLQGKAILDRLNRIILQKVEISMALYQPKAELLGRCLGVEPHVWQIFTEETLRNDWLFLLSRLVTRVQKALRQAAGWSATEVLVPGRVQGIVTRAYDLSSFTSSTSSTSSPSLSTNPSIPPGAPRIVLLEHLHGDEDIPQNVAGIISRTSRDRMSHFGIRAREQGVVWIYLGEESDCREIEKYEGQWIRLSAREDRFDYTLIEKPTSWAMITPAIGERERKKICFPGVRLADSLTFVLPDRYELSTVGPKACQLRLLQERLGGRVRVPDSISVPFGIFNQILEKNPRIHKEYREITADPAKEPSGELSERLRKVRKLIESLDIDESYNAALRMAVQERIGPCSPLIVRSSSNAEDLEEYSGAGLYESYPGVPLSELHRFLKKVWASLWSERAVWNRIRAGCDVFPEDVHMAVLIQELIVADYAFVAHTRHPLTLNREQVYIEAVQGLGESLVGGSEGQGYRFVYDRMSREVSRVGYASKGYSWLIGADGMPRKAIADYSRDFLALGRGKRETQTGTETEPEWQSLMRRIAEIAVTIETAWENRPQDIEGVIKGKEVFIVQTRPQM
ncbi:MAG: PEP/pyruvate-binding domain-containing protein [bacterium]